MNISVSNFNKPKIYILYIIIGVVGLLTVIPWANEYNRYPAI